MKRVAFLLGSLALVTGGAVAATGAVGEFADAWSKIDDYTCSIVVHETLGGQTQDRRYDFAFKKPNLAKIEITSGPGRGSGSVWHGGDTVRGHQGGLLSRIKMNVSINDSRAVTLRGDTIDTASFGHILSVLERGSSKGTLTEGTVETIDGAPTEMIALAIANPAANKNVSRDVVYLSKTTHLPVRRVRYEGATLVKQEDFVNLKLNPKLTEADFR